MFNLNTTENNFIEDLHVLYVEDNKEIRENTLDILEIYFPHIHTAVDGRDGLEKYKAFYARNKVFYDLVITDIQMPYLNGIEMSESILNMYDDQLIIIISAYSEAQYLLELINLGISNFLLKPLVIDRFLQTIYRASQIISNRKIEQNQKKHDQEERDFLQNVIDLQDNFILITDGQKLERVNHSLLNFFNFKTINDFKSMHPCLDDIFIEHNDHFHSGLLKEGTSWIEHILQHKDEDFTVMMQNAKTLEYDLFKLNINSFHDKKRYIVTFSNITKMALQHKEDHHKATYDNLTGVYNRHKLNDLLQHYFSSKRESQTQDFTLILFDIDYFKKINDTYGHLIGDKILIEFIDTIKKNIRRSDILARWGGDEFILIIENTTLQKSMKITEHLRQTIADTIFKKVGHLTCSFGISAYKKDDTIDTLIQRADQAMYHAKKSGRNKTYYI